MSKEWREVKIPEWVASYIDFSRAKYSDRMSFPPEGDGGQWHPNTDKTNKTDTHQLLVKQFVEEYRKQEPLMCGLTPYKSYEDGSISIYVKKPTNNRKTSVEYAFDCIVWKESKLKWAWRKLRKAFRAKT